MVIDIGLSINPDINLGYYRKLYPKVRIYPLVVLADLCNSFA
jgi:hypothetical protein